MKKTYIVDGREFICYVSPSIVNHVEVSIWEVVRPRWKIFRSKYRDSYTFWIFDYKSIDEGVRDAIDTYLRHEWKDECVVAKWKEFGEG